MDRAALPVPLLAATLRLVAVPKFVVPLDASSRVSPPRDCDEVKMSVFFSRADKFADGKNKNTNRATSERQLRLGRQRRNPKRVSSMQSSRRSSSGMAKIGKRCRFRN